MNRLVRHGEGGAQAAQRPMLCAWSVVSQCGVKSWERTNAYVGAVVDRYVMLFGMSVGQVASEVGCLCQKY